MIDPLDDGDLGQARRRVELLQQAVREAQALGAARATALASEIQLRREAERERALALRLRDASALEHERERTRRQEVEQVLESIGRIASERCAWADKGGWMDWRWSEVVKLLSAHLRQGETT